MSKRNLVIAAAALCILAVVTHFAGKSRNPDASTPRIGKSILNTEITEQLDSIKIDSTDSHVELVKKDGIWSIADSDGFPVNLEKLLQITENLTSYKVASLVTKDPERMTHFEVNYKGEKGTLKGTQIVFENKGAVTFKMVVGKNRNSASGTPGASGGTYIRIGDEPVVYLIKEALYLDADPNDWTQRHLFKVDKEEIQSVNFKTASAEYSLFRKDAKAKFSLADLKAGETFNDDTMSDVFIEFKDFNFRKYIEKTSTDTFKGLREKSVVTIATLEGAKLSFKLFEKKLKKDESNYYVEILPSDNATNLKRWKSAFELGKRWIFEISNWKAERWFRDRDKYIRK